MSENVVPVTYFTVQLSKMTPKQPLLPILTISVVVQAVFDAPALDADTVVFNKDRQAFGEIFEVFGPVTQPFYAVRVPEDDYRDIKIGTPIYYAPKVENVTKTVFTDALRK